MPKLPEPVRKKLASEFRFAADRMAETPDIGAKAYFYSAFFGEVNRSMNQFWSAELALLHTVLISSHREIKGRLDVAMLGEPGGGGLPKAFSEAWTQNANDWATFFEGKGFDESEFYRLLARTAEIGYVTTGNGFYLYLKGDISL